MASEQTKPTKNTGPSYGNLANLFDRFNYSVFISFFSVFIFSLISEMEHRTEIAIIVLEVFIAWIVLDTGIRMIFEKMWVLKENAMWYDVLLGSLDFISLLLIFLFFQIMLSMLSDSWKQGNLNGMESTTAIFSIMIVSLSVYHSVKVIFDR